MKSSNSNNKNNKEKRKNNHLYVIRCRLKILPFKSGSVSHSGLLQIYNDKQVHLHDYGPDGVKSKRLKNIANIKNFKNRRIIFHDGKIWTKQKYGTSIPLHHTPNKLNKLMNKITSQRGKYDLIENNCHMAQESVRQSINLKVENNFNDTRIKYIGVKIKNLILEPIKESLKKLQDIKNNTVENVLNHINTIIINNGYKKILNQINNSVNSSNSSIIVNCEDLNGKKISIYFDEPTINKICNYCEIREKIISGTENNFLTNYNFNLGVINNFENNLFHSLESNIVSNYENKFNQFKNDYEKLLGGIKEIKLDLDNKFNLDTKYEFDEETSLTPFELATQNEKIYKPRTELLLRTKPHLNQIPDYKVSMQVSGGGNSLGAALGTALFVIKIAIVF